MTPANLRIAIRAWIANGSPATIEQIIAAFPGYSVHKIQRAVYLLKAQGDLASTGDRRGAKYSVQPINRYKQSELLRQAAIDYIAKHPGATADGISKALGWTQPMTAGRLKAMCDDGELSRKKGTLIRTFLYTALVRKTKSAIKAKAKVTANLSEKAKPKPKPEQITGRYTHIPGKNPNLINSRGQGAIRPRVW